MSNYKISMRNDNQQSTDKIQLSLYLMPFLGAIWAWIKLSNKANLNTEERKIGRLSIRISLTWLIVYATLWLGGNITSDIWAIRFLYLNAIVTTTYFVTCFIFINNILTKKTNNRKF